MHNIELLHDTLHDLLELSQLPLHVAVMRTTSYESEGELIVTVTAEIADERSGCGHISLASWKDVSEWTRIVNVVFALGRIATKRSLGGYLKPIFAGESLHLHAGVNGNYEKWLVISASNPFDEIRFSLASVYVQPQALSSVKMPTAPGQRVNTLREVIKRHIAGGMT